MPRHIVIRSDHRSRCLGEEHWNLGNLDLRSSGARGLFGVTRVVSTDTEHVLGRPWNRRVPGDVAYGDPVIAGPPRDTGRHLRHTLPHHRAAADEILQTGR